jgi:hypothetical protein
MLFRSLLRHPPLKFGAPCSSGLQSAALFGRRSRICSWRMHGRGSVRGVGGSSIRRLCGLRPPAPARLRPPATRRLVRPHAGGRPRQHASSRPHQHAACLRRQHASGHQPPASRATTPPATRASTPPATRAGTPPASGASTSPATSNAAPGLRTGGVSSVSSVSVGSEGSGARETKKRATGQRCLLKTGLRADSSNYGGVFYKNPKKDPNHETLAYFIRERLFPAFSGRNHRVRFNALTSIV